jgi:hypothetical protein
MADSISPSFMGGLMAALSQGLQGQQSAPGAANAGTSPIMNMGLGLMSAAAPHLYTRGNVGEALMGAQQATMQNRLAAQQQQMGDISLQRAQAQMPMIQGISRFIAQKFGNGATGPGPGIAAQGLIDNPSPPQQGGLMNSGIGGMSPTDLMQLGAVMPLAGMEGGPGLASLGENLGFKYNPGFQTQMKMGESPLAVDEAQIQAALAKGDVNLAGQLLQKRNKDLGALSISERNGVVTKLGPTGDIQTFNPDNGFQMRIPAAGGASAGLIPGMGSAFGQKSAAEAQGRATGETADLTDNAGNKYTVPKSVLLSGGGGIGGMPPLAAIGPGRTTMLTDQSQTATQTFKESQAQADASNLQLAQIGDLRAAAHDFTPGKYAESRGEMLQFLASTGLITDSQKNSLGSYQAGQKISIQLQSAATKALGSREAAQVFGAMGKSIPNLTMSQDGLEKVSAFMEGMARYNIARAQTIEQRFNQGNPSGVNAVKDEFYQKTNPTFFILASASPQTRQQMLKSSPNPTKLMTDWVNAYKQGMAPSPAGFQ